MSSNSLSQEFASLIEEGHVSVDIVENPRIGKVVTISDDRGDKYSFSKEQLDKLQQFSNDYKEIILKIHDAEKSNSGIDLAWEIGKIAEKYISEENISNGNFALITKLGKSSDGTYTGQMRNIYTIFPDRDYATDYFSKSILCELTQTISPDDVRRVNNNAKEHDIKIQKKRLRAIRDVYNCENNVESAVEKALDRKLFETMADDELVDVLYDAHLLLGYDNVSKTDIENKI